MENNDALSRYLIGDKFEMDTLHINCDNGAGELPAGRGFVRGGRGSRFSMAQGVVHESQVAPVEITGRMGMDKPQALKQK